MNIYSTFKIEIGKNEVIILKCGLMENRDTLSTVQSKVYMDVFDQELEYLNI
jgi:hypothetical protein